VRILQPLRVRDFRLLWTGMAASLLGDGIYLVAVAFQAYDLENDPSALAIVGVAWTGAMVVFLLLGGVMSDRFARRRVLMAADVVRAVALLAMGLLSVTGNLELWMLVALAAGYGAGEAFFGPSFSALIPEIVPAEQLVQANAIEHSVRPISQHMAGPAIGGVIVAAAGPGVGFLVDAGTFVLSFACLAAMRVREAPKERGPGALREIRAGVRYVRSQTWLWATLAGASISLLIFWGPEEVLVPFVVKNDMGGDASDFGVVLAFAGLGSAAGSFFMGRRAMPRRPVNATYVCFGLGPLPLCLYALATQTWHLMALGFVMNFCFGAGMVIWSTMMQLRVPREMLGRVISLDWFVSIGLVPLSLALTAPVSDVIGIDATFVVAGLLGGGLLSSMLLLVPGLYERRHVVGEAGVADGGGLHVGDLDAVGAGQPGDGADHGEPVVAERVDRPSA
jgi:DHA3 family tetracycline resistance protein-like MFS transporter